MLATQSVVQEVAASASSGALFNMGSSVSPQTIWVRSCVLTHASVSSVHGNIWEALSNENLHGDGNGQYLPCWKW